MDQPVPFQNQETTKSGTNSDSNTVVPVPYWESEIFKNNNQSMLYRVDKSTFVNVARSFLNGMKYYDNDIDVIDIYRKNYNWNLMDTARLEAFSVFAPAVARKNGGDANVKYGWYGGSREQIRDILCYGFRRFENESSGRIMNGVYGRGVYFSSVNNSEASLKLTPDLDGEMHILLCLLILGKSEQIPFGSQINQPTSKEFDSGVDDISNPKKYIIWEPYMNTLAFPIFLVSFKSNSATREKREMFLDVIQMLMTRLPYYVSHSKMAFVKKLYDDFNQKKITAERFETNLKIIVGVDVLNKMVNLHNSSR